MDFLNTRKFKKQLKKYVKKLEKRELSDEEIEKELLVDPESPVIMWTGSISESFLGQRVKQSREELEKEYRFRAEAVEYQWVAIESPNKQWPKEAEKLLAKEDFTKFGAPGTGPCPDCGRRAGRVETMELWEAIGEPGTGWSLCGFECRCKLVQVTEN